jgi:hypothetical protein
MRTASVTLMIVIVAAAIRWGAPRLSFYLRQVQGSPTRQIQASPTRPQRVQLIHCWPQTTFGLSGININIKTVVLKILCKAGWTDVAGEFIAPVIMVDCKRRFGGASAAGITGFIDLPAIR